MVVMTRPMQTGKRFLRASSNGSTLQIAATGISAQGMSVPPPTQMAAICPRAVKVAAPADSDSANRLAIEPAKEMPEKPEPSRPVIAPTVVKVMAAISLVNGTTSAKEAPKSLTIPLEL